MRIPDYIAIGVLIVLIVWLIGFHEAFPRP
jgi:hypothetical protein